MFVYTVPIILTSLLQLTFNATDLIVVGRFCGSISVAAVGSTSALCQMIINFFIGFSIGAGVCVAHGAGARDERQVAEIVHTAIPTAAVSGLILTFLGIILAHPMLSLMATPDNVIRLSASYMRFFFSGMVFMMVYNFGASILRAVGDTTGPLIILAVSGALNVAMNLFFVLVCGMDVDGVGLATALSNVVAAVMVIRIMMRRTDACKFIFKRMRFDRKSFKKIIQIGLPAGIQGSIFAVSNVVIQSSINSFGHIAMTGNAAAQNIEGFEYVCMSSFQQTSMNFAGQNAGARQFDRVKKVTGISLLYVALTGVILSALIFTFRRFLLGIYITDSPEAIEMGIIRMTFVCLPYLLCGMMDTTTGSLRGLGYSMAPMLISLVGSVIFRIVWIATVFHIPQYHTMKCIYVSYPITWVITLSAELIMFAYALRRVRRNARA
ncbi:MAG: MATE family efflux transporter [Bacteroidales bacterium]|nr:MATE family efflux transporter [Bacteroidales bacterium]